ncbi:uncharacterized protein LOC122868653 isoform X1 [Siniperca chuatsi]|uniref:uncharacterized protein LOC122868653 isoform X1 n=1 Tax=Siniperca chuatsi TaxID=119488 RepID=UPI001CE1881E|nr:uncharacterized protein LOC122868653 isoform X1 [Siniperca chuatsi]
MVYSLFDKMTFQTHLIPAMIMAFCMGITLGCPQRNLSCNDIKTSDGFKFPYEGPEGSEIFVHYNEIVIAHALLGNHSFTYFNEVMSMDSHSVITRDCRDLQVKCIVPDGEHYVKETCVNYKITEKMKNPDPNDLPTQWGLIIGVTFVVIAILGIISILCCYLSWKKELKKQQGAATVSQFSFLRHLWTSISLRKGTSQTDTGETETIHHRDQEVTVDDLETQHNNGIRLSEIPSATDPRGSGENDIEEDNTLGSVHVHSIDPKADCKTPQSLSLDRNLSNEGIQPPKNGDTSSASNHRAMHRNLRDDPGGVNDNKGKDIVRAAIQIFDMTGEAAVLVNKHGFDPDQVSGCSTAPDTDVESTHNMKN